MAGEGKTQQLLNMPGPFWAYVEDLKATGLYGSSTASVIRSLVGDGIQAAIGRGLIKLRDFPAPSKIGEG